MMVSVCYSQIIYSLVACEQFSVSVHLPPSSLQSLRTGTPTYFAVRSCIIINISASPLFFAINSIHLHLTHLLNFVLGFPTILRHLSRAILSRSCIFVTFLMICVRVKLEYASGSTCTDVLGIHIIFAGGAIEIPTRIADGNGSKWKVSITEHPTNTPLDGTSK